MRFVIASVVLAFLSITVLFIVLNFVIAQYFNIDGWLVSIIAVALNLITGLASWFLLPALATIFISLFSDKIIARIANHNYQSNISAADAKFWRSIYYDCKFLIKVILLNILILPFYLLAGTGFVLAILVNGYLLGSEFFEIVAAFHLGRKQAKLLRQQKQTQVFIVGICLALFALLPFIKFLMPALALVWMVHLYYGNE